MEYNAVDNSSNEGCIDVPQIPTPRRVRAKRASPNSPLYTPEERRFEAAKRYIEGEADVSSLAKFYKASKPTIYTWIAQYKAKLLEQANMTSTEHMDRSALMLEVKRLKVELAETRDKLVARMIKLGEI